MVDISSDGDNNDLAAGRTLAQARTDTLGVVDAINALVIGDNTLLNYYINNVIGGTNDFALQATDFNSFGGAILRKLTFEIPAPGAMAVLGLGGLVGFRRRR